MQTSRVSVIIPFSKPDVAEVALEKLVHQTYPADLTEIIVVGPGSNALVNRWPIKAIETHPIYYPGEARNIGAAEAAGEYFLFIDDDCEPAPDWIEQNVHELEQPKIGAVGGQIAGKSKDFFAQCVDFSSFAFSQVNRRMETPVCSASLAVKRQAYEERRDKPGAPFAQAFENEATRLLELEYPPVVGTGGEVVAPQIAGLPHNQVVAIETLREGATRIAEDASIRRTDLLLQSSFNALAMGIDAADSIRASNSLEKMLAHFLGEEEEEVDGVIRFAGELLPQFGVLRCDADGASVEVTLPHHNAADRHESPGGDAPLFGPQHGRDYDVLGRANHAVGLHDDPPAQVVFHEHLMRLCQTELPG